VFYIRPIALRGAAVVDARGQTLELDKNAVERLQLSRKLLAQLLQLLASGGGAGLHESQVAAKDLKAVVAGINEAFHADAAVQILHRAAAQDRDRERVASQ